MRGIFLDIDVVAILTSFHGRRGVCRVKLSPSNSGDPMFHTIRVLYPDGGVSGRELVRVGGNRVESGSRREIMDAVGEERLLQILVDLVGLLGTSAAVYEKNGECSTGIIASGWCQYLDEASDQSCETDDQGGASESCSWHCHESTWRKASKIAIETGKPASIECRGCLRVNAVPVLARDEVVGAISFGCDDSPQDMKDRRPAAEGRAVLVAEVDESTTSQSVDIVDVTRNRLTVAAGLIGDVVEGKRIETELRVSEAKYHTLFDDALDMIHVVDREGKIVDANKMELETLGYSREEYIGKELLDVIHPDFRERIAGKLKNVLEGKPERAVESAFLTRSGETVPVEVNAFPQVVDGTVVSSRAIIRNITERKQAEQRLHAQTERAQRYLDIAGVAFVALDREGRVTLLNRRGEDLLGYSAEEIIGQDWFDLCLPERLRADVRSVFRRLIAGEIDLFEYYENPVLTKSGDERIVAWHNTVVRDNTGCVIGTVSSGEDITERRQAEGALKQSEARYQDYYDNSPDMAASVSAKTAEILDCNQTVANALGYTKQEINGRPIFEIYHPDCMEDVKKAFQSFVETGEVNNAELQLKRRDGSKIDVSLNVTAVRDEEGNIVRSRSVWRDITDKKRYEEALRESQEKYRLLVDNQTDMVVRFDVDGRLLFASPSYCRTFGKSEDQLIGSRFMPLIHEQDRERVADAIARVRKPPYYAYMEERARTVNGWRWQAWANTAVRNDAGEVIGIIASGRDVTERKQAEEESRISRERLLAEQHAARKRAEAELEKLQGELVRNTRLAAIGQVSATIAHDVRNPLGSIRNAIFRLKRNAPSDPPFFREYFGIIDDEVTRADTIITNLLSIARAKPPDKEEVDLGQVVADVLAGDPGAAKVRCSMSLDPEPFTIWADADQLTQIVQNLLDNSIAAMDGHGEIAVEAHQDGEHDIITLRDGGPGVAAEVREPLFEPLVTTKAQGTGLGLTICSQIVDLHGGTIELMKQDAGGAAFRIRLPSTRKEE